MKTRNKAAAFFLIMLLSGFSAGLYGVLMLRFEAGDVYPAYSSLRPDPIGAKALFEAFGRIPEISVARNYRPLSKLAVKEQTTLFYIGLRPDFLIPGWAKVTDSIETLAGDGVRVVIAFRSGLKKPAARIVASGPAGRKEDAGEEAQKNATEQPKESEPEKKESPKPTAEKWEVSGDYLPVPQPGGRNNAVASLNEPAEGFPDDLPLHSAFCFKDLGQAWRVLYSAGECPVVIERPWGAGSIVLVADAFVFSNEAMQNERRPGLLARLAGNCRSIVFDEHHLGVSERPGMMTLLRKYRLQGFFAALLLLAGLFFWRNMVRFIPENIDKALKDPGVSSETDQLDGLVNLLRRNIRPAVLLETCLGQWQKSAGRDRRGMDDTIRRACDIVRNETGGRKNNDIAAAYREISRILSDRMHK